jgi:uncharacterized repeat protein (TIGR03803 family)
VAELRIAEFENTVVLYFQTAEPRVNAYALAATLVALADSAKAAARTLNSGVEIEIVVEALNSGSFRAKVTAVAREAGLFVKNQLVTGVVIGVLASYVYDHTLAKKEPVQVIVNTDEVVIVRGNDRVVIPRAIREAQQLVEKNPTFVRSMDRMLSSTILDSRVTGFEGKFPEGGLVQATDGNLYGSTSSGGAGDNGTLYQITTDGVYTQLYSFPKSIGVQPTAALLQDTNGLFYGTTLAGGANGVGSVFSLNMGLGPFVTFVRPTGGVGHAAQILGQGLTGATSVTFNGVAATSFTVVNDTYMTAVVPTGATTGKVVVTTPGGTLTSNVNFRIIH